MVNIKISTAEPIATIAILFDRYTVYQRRYAQSIAERLKAHGYGALFIVGRELMPETGRWEMPYGAGNAIYDVIASSNVTGYILLSGSVGHNLNIDQIDDFVQQYTHKPTVSIGVTVPSVDSITSDNQHGMYALMEHLVKDAKNKNFAFIGGFRHNEDSVAREEIFRDVLTKNHLSIDESKIVYANFDTVEAYGEASAMLKRERHVDAIVCANDYMAYATIKAANDLGLSVPDDVVVTGFDDTITSKISSPPITTITQPFEQQGFDAAERLLCRVNGAELPAELLDDKRYEGRLVIRSSSCREVQRAEETVHRNDAIFEQELNALKAIVRRVMGRVVISDDIDADTLLVDMEATLRHASRQFPDRIQTILEARAFDETELGWCRVLQGCLVRSVVENFSALVSVAAMAHMVEAISLLNERVWSIHNSSVFETARANEFQAHIQILMGFSKDHAMVLDKLDDFLKTTGFTRAFVVLHDDPSEQLMGQVRLRYNLSTGVVEDKQYFDISDLLPEHLQSELAAGQLLIHPLFVDQQHFGLLIVEAPMHGYIDIEYLSHAVSSALRNCYQIESLRQRSSDLVAAYASLSRTANYDELTGLANRSLFKQTLQEAFQFSDATQNPMGILFFDLDGFKTINDSLGHSGGDQLLEVIAARLRRLFREPSKVARLGGDEFAVIINEKEDFEAVDALAERMMDVISEPCWLGTRHYSVSASVGWATYPEHGGDIDTLVKHADIAMYRAKDLGKNRLVSFTPQMLVDTMDELLLDQEMRKGLEQNEFYMVYQPRYELKSNRLVGFEALMRWAPVDDRVSSITNATRPDRFITLAEKTGFIDKLDTFAMETSSLQSKDWEELGHQVIVAINLSAVQLAREDIARDLVLIVHDIGANPRLLELEVTESAAMNNVEQTIACLNELRAAGVHLSIDDFGTGYSSMNYLKQLPVDNLKIDRSFVQGIDTAGATDTADIAIVSAIVALGKSMGFNVIAEGVETDDQRQFLLTLGCDEAQGYFLGKPMEVEAATALLFQQRVG